MNILIVDDDVDLCMLMGSALKTKYEVHSLHNLRDARSHLSRCTTNLLLLDNSLPDGKGIDFIREAHRLDPVMKIVLVTADAPPEVERRAIEAGACRFLAKPFDLPTLNKVVKNIFSSAA